MIFLKTKTAFENEDWKNNFQDSEYRCVMKGEIKAASNDYNDKMKGKAYFFPSRISKNMIELGFIMHCPTDVSDYVNEVFGFLGLDPDAMDLYEITFDAMRSMLGLAAREDFIDDDDDVVDMLGLGVLNRHFSRNAYGESVMDGFTKKDLYEAADHFMARDTLIPELDRIYAGSAKSNVFAHPVHYIVESDDKDARNGLYQVLVNALYDNNRVLSQRYAYLNFNPGSSGAGKILDAIYRSCTYGTVVLRYIAENDDEDDTATAGRETVEELSSAIRKYRDSVLTILCLPAECTNVREMFLEELGGLSFVEIKNDEARAERAGEYLKYRAREKHVRCDKKLTAGLDADKEYNITELGVIFDEWYDNKIKNTVFPQYKETATAKVAKSKEKPKGSAYSELSEMIGLADAKKVIDQALAYNKAKKLFADRGMKDEGMTMHMVFTGNPGTAKTSVARLFARIMRENGIVSRGQMIEVGRSDLVGKYVGWTAPTIKKKFKEASGGVLFIDEAYSLVDDRNGSFGDEAINTIVQEMENHREDVIVIFAGYPNEMEQLLCKNPGLRSRIAFNVNFPDYSADELVDISELIAGKKGMKISQNAKEKLDSMFRRARLETDFGNGRYARNVMEKAKMAHAQRLIQMDYDKITDREIVTIDAEDIEVPEFRHQKKTMGFCG